MRCYPRGPTDNPIAAGFTDVDRSTRIEEAAGYLAHVAALESVARYKRRALDLLAVQPGMAVLDAGCGTGDDVRAISALTGPTGRVVGLDYSEARIATARRRADDLSQVEFVHGDVCRMAFANNSFDRSRTERCLQHVADPAAAVRELARVTRPGGFVLAIEPDWGTLVIEHRDADATEAILTVHRSRLCRNPFVGRRLIRMYRDAGLEETQCEPVAVAFDDAPTPTAVLQLRRAAETAVDEGAVEESRATAWLDWLLDPQGEGGFCALMCTVMVLGRKPG